MISQEEQAIRSQWAAEDAAWEARVQEDYDGVDGMRREISDLRAENARLREVLKSYADPSGYTDNYGEPYTEDDDNHPGTLARAALSAPADGQGGEG